MKYRFWHSFCCFHATPQVEDSPIDVSQCSAQISERLPSDRIKAQICKMMSLPPITSLLPLDKCSCHISHGGLTFDPHSATSHTLMIPCCDHHSWNSLNSFSATSTSFIHALHSGTSSGVVLTAADAPIGTIQPQVFRSSGNSPSSYGASSPVDGFIMDGMASESSKTPIPQEPPTKHASPFAFIRPRGGTVTDWPAAQETDFSLMDCSRSEL